HMVSEPREGDSADTAALEQREDKDSQMRELQRCIFSVRMWTEALDRACGGEEARRCVAAATV
ncbi:MAG: hypothetical protein ACPIOQ_72330, partial [Promethearchaeia archaeon]